MTLRNRTRVQNHIKGVHACGMALLAESATGDHDDIYSDLYSDRDPILARAQRLTLATGVVFGTSLSVDMHAGRHCLSICDTIHMHACMHALTPAAGAVFGMNLPDDKLPLLKSMTIDYTRVAKGDLRGVAALRPQDKAAFLADPKVCDI